MINATQIRAGSVIVFKGDPHKVLSVGHVKPGKGGGFMQTKLRNLLSGLQMEHRFRSEEKVERAYLDGVDMEYLYPQGDDEFCFMNTENYEQVTLTAEVLGDNVYYLKENVVFVIEYFKTEPVSVTPPKMIELEITDTPPNLKGATATQSLKPATLETGLVVQVPPFVETGEIIRVDTVENKYIERAK